MYEFDFFYKMILATAGASLYFFRLMYIIFKPKFLIKYPSLAIPSKFELAILYLLAFSLCALGVFKIF